MMMQAALPDFWIACPQTASKQIRPPDEHIFGRLRSEYLWDSSRRRRPSCDTKICGVVVVEILR
jgi:hypothetical protein